MDEQQVHDTINSLDDVRERQGLRALYQQEGWTELFRAALAAALERQAEKRRREEVVMRPARWAAGKAGRFVGRAMRKLEEQAEKADQAKKS